jgi:puromycin-sensitive aminopeptidase
VLEPDLDAASFSGTLAAAVEVVEPVDEVVVNVVDIDIDEAWLEPADGTGTRVDASVTLDEATERARLALPHTIEPGAWVVHFVFRGTLNDKLTGFYRSTYKDDDGVDRTIAVTQFEATHARRAFPSWDEPEMKAVFAITLVVEEALTAISNAAVVSDEPTGDGRRRVRFADTMPMSTYIVAWVVGPLDATAPTDVNGTPVRIAFPPGNEHLTPFALESAEFALRYFADYYAIPYPGDKCDLLAVPDFAFGAMENLGCITFREALLLVDPNRSTQPELQRVADVIHHELAHMWFGDLVTMKWWNGIWLNEAFATFMETKCTELFRPEWDRWTDFGLSRSAAMDVDALVSTRPIEFEVISPKDAEGMFDVLTYEKGASVLRMLEQYLGEESFRDGIRHYLSTNAYGNTETTDLWDAIESCTNEPVRNIMDTWIFQGGYPMLSFEVADGTTLRLSQERFRFATGDGVPPGDERWDVPVLLRYGRGDEVGVTKVLLTQNTQELELQLEPDWVQLNAGGSGFYRVRYTPEQLAQLRAHLPSLSSLERYQLVDDAFASVLAGATTATEFLELVRHFADDDDVSVWQRIAGALGLLDRIIDDDARAAYQGIVRALAAPVLKRMGFEPQDDESDRHRQLRATLFELVGTVGGDTALLARARAIHDAFQADPDAVDPALAAASINVIADHGDADDYASFVKLSLDTDNPQVELRYLYALARFADEASFRDALDRALTEVRTQNAPFLLARALMNRANGPVAWDFVRRNWDTINDRFPSSTIVRMAEGIKGLVEPAVARDVLAFFAEHPVPQGEKTMSQHLERLRVNVALQERDGAALARSLSA